jgi:5-formyltetrahydrofolate cyclo-ligase
MTSAADDLTADVARAKRAARGRALAARDALAPAGRARLSALVCARAAALPELRGARSILLFASFRSEVDTRTLLDALLARGAAIALPRIIGPHLLEARHVTDPDTDLEPGVWGIPEPREGLPAVPPRRIDAVVVPGAAFSVAGARCGYGGGFYDAYLPKLRPGTPRIALAFEVQVVAELPSEPHDLRVDVIATESRVIRPQKPAGGRGD